MFEEVDAGRERGGEVPRVGASRIRRYFAWKIPVSVSIRVYDTCDKYWAFTLHTERPLMATAFKC